MSTIRYGPKTEKKKEKKWLIQIHVEMQHQKEPFRGSETENIVIRVFLKYRKDFALP